MTEVILEVKGLKTWFYTDSGIVKAVNGVDFTVERGECLCLVGESGCGKSVTALSILRLFDSPPGKIVDGCINYKGLDLAKCHVDHLRKIRGKEIALIFQNAQSSLNPVFTIGDQIVEQITANTQISHKKALERAGELLQDVNIPETERALKMYPHQLSGGMRQRAMIAMSLSCNPEVLIADEPTTSVDATIRAQIMHILNGLKTDRGISIIFITHDLSLVREIANRVAVLYAGRVVEVAPVDVILGNPAHPYTIGLIGCLPGCAIDHKRLHSIAGNTPSPINLPAGCPFHPRCPKRMDKCSVIQPELMNISAAQKVACHLYNGISENDEHR